ncbi:MAG: hypothetical protein U1E65_02655 [Myxococcota bacterium]
MRIAAALLVLFCGCARASAEDPRVVARDQARLVLERHCGACHIPESGQALPAALAVYDLTAPEWAAKMNDRQLLEMKRRIEDGAFFDEFDERNRGQSPPPKPSQEEQATVRRYVDLEREYRATTPAAGRDRYSRSGASPNSPGDSPPPDRTPQPE